MTRDHPALPPPVSRPWVLVAAICWAGAVAASALWLEPKLPPLPAGPIVLTGVMSTDVLPGEFGPWALVETGSGPVLVDLPPGTFATRGQVVALSGSTSGEPGVARGDPHRGTVRVEDFEVVSEPRSPLIQAGSAIRDRVTRALADSGSSGALLAGFLVGDTSGLDEVDVEAMRRAGLSHFTAVSGSNVALFLALLFAASGPLSWGPKRRAVLGLVGLPIYAAATRFEPSVMRASAMAAIVLGGRMFGLVLEAWQLLASAVVGILLLDPRLATHVGFQLSVAATAGVLVGSRWPVGPGKARRALAITIAAQLAVAPLLIAAFGGVPLLSAPVNLVAAPLVASATVLGAVGVAGATPLLAIAVPLAGMVLGLARGVASWPQVGWEGVALILGIGMVYHLFRQARGPIAVGVAVGVVAMVLGAGAKPPDAGVVALDVGQGDALLISGGDGRFALVDGGPDPVELIESLATYRVRRLELVVLTHAHADHAAGLAGLAGRIPIDLVWADVGSHANPASTEVLDQLGGVGAVVLTPAIGAEYTLGELRLTVRGPLRRYASPNDESIVLEVTGPMRSMLLTGDVEAIAQEDLGRIDADVLKVPHHGAATSNNEWLAAVGSDLAVISVGENDFGHPAPEVISALEAAGAVVVRTDLEGDVIVDLG